MKTNTVSERQANNILVTSSIGSMPIRPGNLLRRTRRKAGGVSGGINPIPNKYPMKIEY